jgi:hypothetical protein
LKKTTTNKRAGGVAQGVSPEFKPQYGKKKKCTIGRVGVVTTMLGCAIVTGRSAQLSTSILEENLCKTPKY